MNHADWLAPVCAALILAGYLSQVPVVAALAVSRGGMGVGIGAFHWRGAMNRAQKRAAGVRPSRKKGRLVISFADKRRLLRFLWRHGTLEYLRVTGVIALAGARRTCLAVGAVRSLCAALGRRGEARVTPAFSGTSTVEAEGVVSMRLGHLLIALGMALRAQAAARHPA